MSFTFITCELITSHRAVYIENFRLPLPHARVRLLSIFAFTKSRPPTCNLGKWPTGPVHHLLLVQLHSFIWWLLLQLSLDISFLFEWIAVVLFEWLKITTSLQTRHHEWEEGDISFLSFWTFHFALTRFLVINLVEMFFFLVMLKMVMVTE